jgi:hypothetical protein
MSFENATVTCWSLGPQDVTSAGILSKPFKPYYSPYLYFRLVRSLNENIMEGHLGHENFKGGYHKSLNDTYSYLISYNNGEPVYFTFDKVTVYQVTGIFPADPLIFTFKKVAHQHFQYHIPQKSTPIGVAKMEQPIHFEDLGGLHFERLVHAYLNTVKTWYTLEWLGQTGGDNGRDLWGVIGGESYCYQCANHKALALSKVAVDLAKLHQQELVPTHFILICGGAVSAKLRAAIAREAKQYSINNVEVWSGAEFEEKLRKGAPDVLARFFDFGRGGDMPVESAQNTTATKNLYLAGVAVGCRINLLGSTELKELHELIALLPKVGINDPITLGRIQTGIHWKQWENPHVDIQAFFDAVQAVGDQLQAKHSKIEFQWFQLGKATFEAAIFCSLYELGDPGELRDQVDVATAILRQLLIDMSLPGSIVEQLQQFIAYVQQNESAAAFKLANKVGLMIYQMA